MVSLSYAILLVLDLQQGTPVQRVYGGETVPRGELPEVVALGGTCTGVLIGPRLVLSAAHCGIMHETIEVDGEVRAVDGCSSMSQWADAAAAGTGRDFLGCLLSRDAPVAPLRLWTHDVGEAVSIGDDVQIVGYGEDESGLVGTKRAAFTRVFEVDDEYFAVGGEGVDTCRGDSGSPALVEAGSSTYVAGILSFGYRCGEGGWYGHAEIADTWLREEFGDEYLAVGDPESAAGCTVAAPGARQGHAWIFLLGAVGAGFRSARRRARRERSLPRCAGRTRGALATDRRPGPDR